jgi:hypothetical protein
MKQQQKTTNTQTKTRADKALEIVQSGGVVRIHDDCYYVKSQNPRSNREYEVIPSMNVCNYEDFLRNGIPCKHCIAVQIYRTNQIATAITAAKLEALSKLGRVVKAVGVV